MNAHKRISAGRETGVGSGALFYCPTTQNYLLVKRSTTGDYPNTWCSLGGGVESGETLAQAARREAYEEAGFPQNAPCKLLYFCKVTSLTSGFVFHNHLCIVNEEFTPKLNDEHTDYMWVQHKDFPTNVHPGLLSALESKQFNKVRREMKINAHHRICALSEEDIVSSEEAISRMKRAYRHIIADYGFKQISKDVFEAHISHSDSEEFLETIYDIGFTSRRNVERACGKLPASRCSWDISLPGSEHFDYQFIPAFCTAGQLNYVLAYLTIIPSDEISLTSAEKSKYLYAKLIHKKVK